MSQPRASHVPAKHFLAAKTAKKELNMAFLKATAMIAGVLSAAVAFA